MSSRISDRLSDGVPSIESSIAELATEPEFTGHVGDFEKEHSNGHLAVIYEADESPFRVTVPYVRQGLDRGERCLYVVDEENRSNVLEALRAGGIDVDAALESGDLVVPTVQDTYLRNGSFSPDDTVEFYAEVLEESLGEYDALRVTAETAWLVGEDATIEEFLAYESQVNELFDGVACSAVCQFDRRNFSPEVVRSVLETHPHLIYDGTLCQNVYYTPPEEFFGPDAPDREVDRMLGTLVGRATAKGRLRERERFLRELYELSAEPDLSFADRVERLLELGRDRFGLEYGLFARFESGSLVIEQSVGDHELLSPGATTPLEGTYCRTFHEDGRTELAIADVSEAGWAEDPAYDRFGLESYLGTSIEVDGALFGSLCFGSGSARDRPFGEDERTFLELMAQWLEYELTRRQRERFLRESYAITSDPHLDFEAKLHRMLDLGRDRFDMEVGGVSVVDERADRLRIEQVSGDSPVMRSGTELPLSETYCGATVDEAGIVAITGPDDDHVDPPIGRELGVQTYFGAHVPVRDAPDRTFCYASTDDRHREFSDADRTLLHLMGQWAKYELERHHREEQLAALNAFSRELLATETETAVCETLVETADGRLSLPIVGIALYDKTAGRLEVVAETPQSSDQAPTASLVESDRGIAWEAFVEDEQRRVAPADVDSRRDVGAEVSELAVFPLDRHGVLVVGSTAADGFSSTQADVVETVAATVRTALDRADRQARLEERERTLANQNATLERLDRINGIIRNIDRSLVRANDRSEIARATCEELAEVGPYEMAWIGETDGGGAIEPIEWAGAEAGYLEGITITTDERPTGAGPAGRAVTTREQQVVNDVLGAENFGPWREAALKRGYHAVVALPLVYRDSLYGVLVVYANTPGVFGDLERSVLSEMSDTIAYAMNAVESKKALVGEDVTVLEFSLDDGHPLIDVLGEHDGSFTQEAVFPQTGGGFRAYFTVNGLDSDSDDWTHRLPVRDVQPVADGEATDDSSVLYEGELTCQSLTATILEHGGRPLVFDADGQGATVTVELGADADVRGFVDGLESSYPDVNLVAQRTGERSTRSPREHRATLIDELTDRQLEAIRTAYFSGYFERPRTQTGSEIAERMDITQPTFTTHLRAAERQLCRQLFETDGIGPDR